MYVDRCVCSVCSHRVFPKASVVNGMAASLNKETTPDLCSRPQVDVRRLGGTATGTEELSPQVTAVALLSHGALEGKAE